MKNDVKVWDLPTRLFHWSLVVLVVVSWLTAEDKGLLYILHTVSGYLVFLLILFRFVWGWLGNDRARFGDFVRPWPVVRSYIGGLWRFKPARSLGHNPLGGWMVVLLLLFLLAITVTGMVGAAREPGALLNGVIDPTLSRSIRHLHELLANILYFLVGLHILGVLADWILTGDNLIRAMVTGRKPVEEGTVAADARGGSPVVAAVIAAILVALGVFLIAYTSF
ncbi:MAG: cytochrome b/b6 domain-containing protein [Candidatus Eiseniibacteriota bacterium]